MKIESVLSADGRKDRYVPGQQFVVRGRGFGDFREVPMDLGLYLLPIRGGRLVRIFRYLSWKDGEIHAECPQGVVGAQKLILETRGSAHSSRSATYRAHLLP